MMIPYTRYRTSNGQLESLPLVSVRLAHKGKHQKVWALIDSGADVSVFNSDIASLLGLTPNARTPNPMVGLIGGAIDAWLHPIELTVGEFPSVAINVAFTDTNIPDVSILGQRGFFDNFQIRFQRYKDLIEIYPRSTSI
jgi:aspartyl protease